MRFLRKFLFSFSLSFLFLFAGCATLRSQVLSPEEEALLYPVEMYLPENFEWEEVCPGIERVDFENPDIPLIYHAVKVDLGLAGVAAPGPDGPLKLVFGRGLSTAKFANSTQCAVAVNATPFTRSGKLVGLHKEEGVLLSQPVARYGAIAFRAAENGRNGLEACIFASQADEELEDWPYVLGGFFTVLENGKVQQDFVRRGDSRSGVGLSADGKSLFILVAEGEKPGKSRGLSYPQCGQVFKAMGCSDALELDGGSSSELCILGKSVLSYKVITRQANSLGVWIATSLRSSQ